MTTAKKVVTCIKTGLTWGVAKPVHKFDNEAFDPKIVKKDIHHISPKLEELVKHITQLDAKDKEKHGKLFKHLIYTDVGGVHGAKMIASVLISEGHTLVDETNLKKSIDDLTKQQVYNRFVMLTTAAVHKKTMTVKHKKAYLDLFNVRPSSDNHHMDNRHGELARFLIIDPGFREGIDVFDIKYIHLVEPLDSNTATKQVIGRGTRFCGQSGLAFHPVHGWPLFVYRYDVEFSKEFTEELYGTDANAKSEVKTGYDLLMHEYGIDVRYNALCNELEQLCTIGAVDATLTRTVHGTVEKNSLLHKDDQKQANAHFKGLQNMHRNCDLGCFGPLKQVPTDLLLIVWLLHSQPRHPVFSAQWPRATLCNQLVKNHLYCKAVTDAWTEPIAFIRKYHKQLESAMTKVESPHKKEMNDYINSFLRELANENSLVPPNIPYSNDGMDVYVAHKFGSLKWKSGVFKNLCAQNAESITESKSTLKELANAKDKDKDVKKLGLVFNKSQEFMRHYFTPVNPYKGMLVYHSVGTGKLCTGIATASSSFEVQGYQIIWVTRHTLKSDVWKNMFENVCNANLRSGIEQGKYTEADLKKNGRKLLSPNWWDPLSYKQLGNVLQNKNKTLYNKLTEINGKTDPLKKTLLVFDEAHNLFSPDIKLQERPNVSAIIKAIDHSYKVSGKDSARVLLLTATPILNNPMSLLSLMNLIMEKHERFEINIDDFMAEFPLFSEKPKEKEDAEKDFIERITGKISYLNREKDGRQFARPILKDILVAPPPQEDLTILKQRADAADAAYHALKCKQKDVECKKRKADLKIHAKELKTEYAEKEESNEETLLSSITKCIEEEKERLAKVPPQQLAQTTKAHAKVITHDASDVQRPRSAKYVPRPGTSAFAHVAYRNK